MSPPCKLVHGAASRDGFGRDEGYLVFNLGLHHFCASDLFGAFHASDATEMVGGDPVVEVAHVVPTMLVIAVLGTVGEHKVVLVVVVTILGALENVAVRAALAIHGGTVGSGVRLCAAVVCQEFLVFLILGPVPAVRAVVGLLLIPIVSLVEEQTHLALAAVVVDAEAIHACILAVAAFELMHELALEVALVLGHRRFLHCGRRGDRAAAEGLTLENTLDVVGPGEGV